MTVVANALLAQSYRAQDTMALRESFIMLRFSNRPSVELRIHDKPKPPKHQDWRTQASRKYYKGNHQPLSDMISRQLLAKARESMPLGSGFPYMLATLSLENFIILQVPGMQPCGASGFLQRRCLSFHHR